MYYRVAIQEDSSSLWQWKSTVLSDLTALFQFLRRYRPLGYHRLRVFSSLSHEEINEQLMRMNRGLESTCVTATQFLQERLIDSSETAWKTSRQEYERTAPIAAIIESSRDESMKGGNAQDGRIMSPLERRREELECGGGGDHEFESKKQSVGEMDACYTVTIAAEGKMESQRSWLHPFRIVVSLV